MKKFLFHSLLIINIILVAVIFAEIAFAGELDWSPCDPYLQQPKHETGGDCGGYPCEPEDGNMKYFDGFGCTAEYIYDGYAFDSGASYSEGTRSIKYFYKWYDTNGDGNPNDIKRYVKCIEDYAFDQNTNLKWQDPEETSERECPVIDTDGDGIPDAEDPFPDDAGGFTWTLEGQILDENLNPVKSFYKVCSDTTGECHLITVGDGEGGHYAQIRNGLTGTENNAPWLDTGNLVTEGGYEQEVLEGDGSPNYQQGDTDSGDGTDNSLLGQIANNTQRSVDNQGEMGKQLEAIASKGDMTNSILSEIASNTNEIANKTGTGQGTEVNIDTPTAEEIGGAVEDALSNDEGVDYGAAQGDSTALDTAYNDAITGINEQLTIGDAPESMQERTVIEDKFGDLMLNPDLQDAQNVITGSGVNLSGSCSFTYDYKGTPITFSVCNFESQIDMMGNVLLSLAGLTSILIVFRRG